MNKLYYQCTRSINSPNNFEAKIDGFISNKVPLVVFQHSLNEDIPSHTHNFFELIHVKKGPHQVIVDNQTLTLHTNDICLLNRKAVHSINYSKNLNSPSVSYLMINPDYFQDIFFQYVFLNSENYLYQFLIESQFNEYKHQNYLVLSNTKETLIPNLIKNIITEFFSENIYKEKMLSLQLCSLMMDISRYYEKNYSSIRMQKEDNFHKKTAESIIQYIYSNSQTITLKKLAIHFNYNEFYLSSLIKQYSGNTFTDILQSIRFQKICAQLIENDLPIQKIVFENGYTNVSWFTKKFKEYFHKTPSEFRKSYKN